MRASGYKYKLVLHSLFATGFLISEVILCTNFDNSFYQDDLLPLFWMHIMVSFFWAGGISSFMAVIILMSYCSQPCPSPFCISAYVAYNCNV